MSTTETTQAHEHAFPVQPPEGSMWAPGRCRECGKTWELAQAENAMAGAQAAMEMAGMPARPLIVCLCGSTRFKDEINAANARLTMQGVLVISLGVFGHTDLPGRDWTTGASDDKRMLDDLHRRKIDLADEVLVVSDESGYFGESTAGEIRYATGHGKPVRFAERAAQDRAEEMELV